MEEMIVRHGIEITVTNKHTPSDTWETYFSNAPGNFNQLHHVKALRGFGTKEEALEAGKKFVDDHQWQYVEDMDIFSIHVRFWGNDEWGYSIRCGGMENNSGFTSREDAITAAKKRTAEKVKELEEKIKRNEALRKEMKGSDGE